MGRLEQLRAKRQNYAAQLRQMQSDNSAHRARGASPGRSKSPAKSKGDEPWYRRHSGKLKALGSAAAAAAFGPAALAGIAGTAAYNRYAKQAKTAPKDERWGSRLSRFVGLTGGKKKRKKQRKKPAKKPAKKKPPARRKAPLKAPRTAPSKKKK